MVKDYWKAKRIFTERLPGTYFTAYRKSDMADMGRFYPGITNTGPLAEFSDFVAHFIESSLPLAPVTVAEKFSSTMYGGYGLVETGQPSPVPADLILSSPIVKTNNGIKWREAPSQGTIVVSDFQRMQILLSFENGGRVSESDSTFHSVSCVNIMPVMQIPLQRKNGKDYYDIQGEYFLKPSGACNIVYTRTSITDEVTAYDDGFQPKVLQQFLDNPKAFYSYEFHSKATEVVAEANTGTLDILTSLAELPETIKSIYDGLKFMLKGAKDVKRKRLSFLNKSKKLKLEHQRRVFRLEYESRKEFLKARNDKTRKLIAAKLKLAKRQLGNDLKLSLKALTSAAADVWLNYRYNIEPTVLMIEDAIDALHFDKNKFFHRWRGRLQSILTFPDMPFFSKSGQATMEERIFIKRAFQAGISGFQNLSASIFVTAWELIPLSFVVDWIVNVGDFIATSASGSLNKDYKQGATKSLQAEGVITYTGVNQTKVTATLSGYTRSVINPNDLCRLAINPDVSGKRQIDALALSWNIFLKKNWKF